MNHLSRLGFSITPEEVLRFKQPAVENMDKDQEPVTEQGFAQWVADNVDHNVATLTGKNTFHGMGIICVSEKPLQGRYGNIPRIKERRKASSFVEKRGVEIIPYPKSAQCTYEILKVDPILYLKSPIVFPPDINYDEMISSNTFIAIANEVEELKTKLKAKSRTAKLWLLYLDYISVAKLFILAERTSDWELHLHTVTEMLNLFASTGHKLCS